MTTININHYIRRKQINQPSLIYITLFTVQMRTNKLYIPGYVLIRRFSHILNFSGLKNFFLAKLLMSYLKYYISLVSYKKSEKSNDWLPRNARKCQFFTPISPFLTKKNCFGKSGSISL